ncbi:hypothetical protein FG379_003132 [Cryptosporidium bovis]|uniref:uncharacterized protein n=1 Tax=Cryptosporidium bovis TaxID=310047 RepID=UPI00351A20A6|nr:hypothetical protein FG379_003132 [Cryptosporidium bovis]
MALFGTLLKIILALGLEMATSEVVNVLNFQSDINLPIVSGGDLPPDNSYDVYRKIWGITQEEIESMEINSLEYFNSMTDIDLINMPQCTNTGNVFSLVPVFKLQPVQPDTLNAYCLTRTMDGVIYVYDPNNQKRIASFYHVRNLDIIGYKLVQSIIPKHEATENPLPLLDTGFVLNVLEDNYFPCSKFKSYCIKGDRMLYGWYTIRDLYKKGEWGVIHYESRGPQNILKQFTPLSFRLDSKVWGKGFSNGFVSRRYANNEIVQPCYENSCPYRIPKMFDTISISFRNVLTFIS